VIPGYFAMGIWLVLPPILFSYFRPHVAALLTFMSAVLFLPERLGFDLPLLPPMGKDELASVACMVCCLAFAPARLMRARPLRGPEILVVVLAAGTVVSVVLNQDVLRYGAFVVPGTGLTDAIQAVLAVVFTWGFPFLIGRAYFTRASDLRDLFVILIFAGLVYSLLILFEIRMSPRLHLAVYGYHQHGFSQTIRGDGSYRPMVFMRHGLNLSLFVVMSMTSAWILVRTRYPLPIVPFVPKLAAAVYLTAILLLCRSTASMLYGLLLLGLVYFVASSRIRLWVAAAFAVLALAYPALRSAQLLPVEEIVQLAEENFGRERAESMAGRLRTEEELTMFIQGRPIFGWATAGRAMVIDEFTGENKTIFDGYWLIEFVSKGVVGFVCVFGLLLWPVFDAVGKVGAIRSKQDRMMISGLSLMVAIHVLDLLANSPTEGYLTLLSGALAGSVFGVLREQRVLDRSMRAGPLPTDSTPAARGSGAGHAATDGSKPTLGQSLLGPSSKGKLRRPRDT